MQAERTQRRAMTHAHFLHQHTEASTQTSSHRGNLVRKVGLTRSRIQSQNRAAAAGDLPPALLSAPRSEGGRPAVQLDPPD